jgi:protein-tyrosine-phosphatase
MGIPAGDDDAGPVVPQPCYVDTAALLGDAMTDYLLAAGTKTAPASGAPEHMAAWLRAHGYRIVRAPRGRPADRQNSDVIDQITALADVRRVA